MLRMGWGRVEGGVCLKAMPALSKFQKCQSVSFSAFRVPGPDQLP